MKINTDSKKIEEILTRNISNIIPSKELLKRALESGKRLRIYIGIDPTGSRLHIGHATNFILLEKLRKLGHEIIILFGDFTALIGDPTGKHGVRVRMTSAEVKENIKTWKKQLNKVVSLNDKKNPAKILKNSSWLSKLKFEDIIDLASNFTVGQIIERDMFQKRIKDKKPIFLHEFFYPIMQGYDSVMMDVDVEIGGNDQLFNMGIGRTLQKRINNKEKFILATTLLENPKTGRKLMSKSEGTFIALDDSPNEMYGKAMALPDEVIIPVFYGGTLLSSEEIAVFEKSLREKINPRDVKMKLAYELVKIYHNETSAKKAQKDFVNVFQKKGNPDQIDVVYAKKGDTFGDILLGARKINSKSVFRRLLKQGAVSNLQSKEKIVGVNPQFEENIVLKIGKKDFIEIKEK